VVIIGVDPHERTHTASALEPGTHRVVATVQNAGNGAPGWRWRAHARADDQIVGWDADLRLLTPRAISVSVTHGVANREPLSSPTPRLGGAGLAGG
jgi:hypothetical protein